MTFTALPMSGFYNHFEGKNVPIVKIYSLIYFLCGFATLRDKLDLSHAMARPLRNISMSLMGFPIFGKHLNYFMNAQNDFEKLFTNSLFYVKVIDTSYRPTGDHENAIPYT